MREQCVANRDVIRFVLPKLNEANGEVGPQSAVLALGVVPQRALCRRIGRSLFCVMPQRQRTANELPDPSRIRRHSDRFQFHRQ